jgi:hypothetical protein
MTHGSGRGIGSSELFVSGHEKFAPDLQVQNPSYTTEALRIRFTFPHPIPSFWRHREFIDLSEPITTAPEMEPISQHKRGLRRCQALMVQER